MTFQDICASRAAEGPSPRKIAMLSLCSMSAKFRMYICNLVDLKCLFYVNKKGSAPLSQPSLPDSDHKTTFGDPSAAARSFWLLYIPVSTARMWTGSGFASDSRVGSAWCLSAAAPAGTEVRPRCTDSRVSSGWCVLVSVSTSRLGRGALTLFHSF